MVAGLPNSSLDDEKPLPQTEPLSVDLVTTDGTNINACFFESPAAKGAILVGCATAVRQRFYRPFARWLVGEGYSVLTFDYRGIGESTGALPLSHCKARKQDWGEQDIPAALDWLAARCPKLTLSLVGHSAGGLLIGLAPNHARLRNIVALGCSTGYVDRVAMPDRIVAKLLLNVYFPLTTSLFGYLPAKRLGWGEDLPKGVALQWADWCNHPGYIRNGFGKDILKNYYDEITIPMLCMNMTDDPITTPANVDELLGLFPNSQMERRWLKPADFGLSEVGHMGFFRPQNRVLWPQVTSWIAGH